jgi:hypothetical protein
MPRDYHFRPVLQQTGSSEIRSRLRSKHPSLADTLVVSKLAQAIHLFSAHRKFEEWTEEYGSVFTLRKGTKVTVVIGRHQVNITR